MNGRHDQDQGGFAATTDLLFLAGLLAWLVMSWSMLPYDFSDLCYFFALDRGLPLTQEWVHPIFLPFLAAYRWSLSLFGFTGGMLIPLEALGALLAALTLSGWYCFCAFWCRSRPCAALSVLTLASCAGFWEGSLRPTPYALTALSFSASLMLLAGPWPRTAVRRWLLAGLAAGLAAALHASALALLPAAAAAAWLEPPSQTPGRRPAALFPAAFLATLAASYAVFVARYGIGSEYFSRHSPREIFHGVEQLPLSSFYTSGSLMSQLRDYGDTLRWQGGPLLWLAAAFCAAAVLLAVLRADSGRLAPLPGAGRALVVVGTGAASLALFFLFNNSRNGFVYGSLPPLAFLTAYAASRARVLRAIFIAAAALALLRPGVTELPAAQDRDPLLIEARFLARALGPRDILALPGRPVPELTYLGHLNILEVACLAQAAPGSAAPRAQPDEFSRRAAAALAQGRRVLLALGDRQTAFTGDVSGMQKQKQVFWADDPDPRRRAESQAALERRLGRSLRLDRVLVSPQGWRYADLRCRACPRPDPDPGAAPWELERLRELLDRRGADVWTMERFELLRRWAAAAPEDRFVRADLAELLVRFFCAGRGAEPQRLLGACGKAPRPEDALIALAARMGRSEFLAEEGIALYAAGDARGAADRLRAAVALDADNLSAKLNLAKLGALGPQVGNRR